MKNIAKKTEKWVVIEDNRKSTYLVSSRGRCKKISKATGEETITRGFQVPSQPKYLRFHHNYVHRLVAEAFLPNPSNYEQVDHINCNPLDNRASNLRWTSRKENNTRLHAQRLRSKNAKFTSHQGQMLRAEREVDGETEVRFYKSGIAAARDIGCSSVLVYRAANPDDFAKRACGWKFEWVSCESLLKVV